MIGCYKLNKITPRDGKLEQTSVCSFLAQDKYTMGISIGPGISIGNGIAMDRVHGPDMMFGQSEVGVWYEPADLSEAKLAYRRNLLSYSEDFTNAAWTKAVVTATPSAALGPDGLMSMTSLTETVTGSSTPYIFQMGVPTTTTGYITCSVYAKAGGRDWIYFICIGRIPTVATVPQSAWFNVATGALGSVDTGGVATITSVGNGIYRCTFTRPITNSLQMECRVGCSSASGIQTYVSDGRLATYLYGAQMEQAATATAYQKVTNWSAELVAAYPQYTLYQDSNRVTAVTAMEQPVGLMMDKSKGLAPGPELMANGGPFTATTGWTPQGTGCTISIVNGALRVSQPGGAYPYSRAYAAITTVVGGVYQVTGTATLVSGTGLVYMDASTLGYGGIEISNGMGPNVNFTFTAVGTTTYILCLLQNGNMVGDFNLISVHNITGNHAYQATTTKRPVLSARVNLLTYSEDLTNAAWTKTVATTQNAVAPDGTTTAWTVTKVSGALDYVFNSVVLPVTTCTFSVLIKKTVGATVFPVLQAIVNPPSALATIDTNNGIATVWTAYTGLTIVPSSATCVSYDANYWKVSLTSTVTAATWRFAVYPAFTSNATQSTGVGNGALAGSCVVCQPQVEFGAVATTYQWITSASVYNTSGFKRYLKFDGVDDFMVTSVIPFNTDKVTVFYGVTNLVAGTQTLFELGTNVTLVTYTFSVAVSNTVSGDTVLVHRASGSYTYPSTPAKTFPWTAVVAASADSAGTTYANSSPVYRVNGATPTITLGGVNDTGTGNFSASYPMYIGARAGTGIGTFFSGKLYSIIIRGTLCHADQITGLETYVNNLTGAY
jgi:hypothetical protein